MCGGPRISRPGRGWLGVVTHEVAVAFVETLLLVLVTAFGSLAVYELLVRQWKMPRLLFGLKIAAPIAQRAASV